MPDCASDIEGFILTGGASSRMGVDKAQLRLGRDTAAARDVGETAATADASETFVSRITRALAPIVARTRLVSARGTDAQAGLAVVPDVFAGAGALAGLHAALSACATPWAFVVSCDLPFVTTDLFRCLAAQRNDGIDAVVPVQPDGRVQPLCALYRCTACLPDAEALLRAGERRARRLPEQLRARWVEPQSLSDLPRSQFFFLNVNTPADYESAQAQATGLADDDTSSSVLCHS